MSRAQAPRRQACKHSEFVRGGRPSADFRGLLARSFGGSATGGINRTEGTPPKAPRRRAATARRRRLDNNERQQRCEMVMLTPGGERESVLSHVAGLRPDQRPDRDGALVADTDGALLVRRDAHGVHGLAMRDTFGGSHALVVGPDLHRAIS